MDAFDWYHVLTPLAIIVCTANFLLGFTIKPEFRSTKNQTFSNMSILGCLLGWFIMLLAISVKSIDLLIKLSIIGWLILLPSILLSAACVISKLRHEQSHYFQQAIQLKNIIFKYLKFIVTALLKLLQALYMLIAGFLMHKHSKYQYNHDAEFRKKSPYIFDEPMFGEPPRNAFGEVIPPHERE